MEIICVIWVIMAIMIIITSIIYSIYMIVDLKTKWKINTAVRELDKVTKKERKKKKKINLLKPVKKAIKKLDERVNKNERI